MEAFYLADPLLRSLENHRPPGLTGETGAWPRDWAGSGPPLLGVMGGLSASLNTVVPPVPSFRVSPCAPPKFTSGITVLDSGCTVGKSPGKSTSDPDMPCLPGSDGMIAEQ